LLLAVSKVVDARKQTGQNSTQGWAVVRASAKGLHQSPKRTEDQQPVEKEIFHTAHLQDNSFLLATQTNI